jgi:hypothetical protein
MPRPGNPPAPPVSQTRPESVREPVFAARMPGRGPAIKREGTEKEA